MHLSGYKTAREPTRSEVRKRMFADMARKHRREWGDNKTPWIESRRTIEFPTKRGGSGGVRMARGWFSSWNPSWWTARASGKAAATLDGLGLVASGTISAPAESGTGGSLLDTISSIFTQAIPAYTQYRLTKENAELVKQGKAPLDTSQMAPSVRVIAEPGQAAQNLTKIALVGGGALAGLFILTRMIKKR